MYLILYLLVENVSCDFLCQINLYCIVLYCIDPVTPVPRFENRVFHLVLGPGQRSLTAGSKKRTNLDGYFYENTCLYMLIATESVTQKLISVCFRVTVWAHESLTSRPRSDLLLTSLWKIICHELNHHKVIFSQNYRCFPINSIQK